MEKTFTPKTRAELRDLWSELSPEDQISSFKSLSALEAGKFFAELDARDQAKIILSLPLSERQLWIRVLNPDDAADVIQETDESERQALLDMLDQVTRNEVSALLAYAEDVAGGLMNPRYVAIRPDMSVDEAISYIRLRAREQFENVYYIYVVDSEQRLLGVASMRDLFQAASDQKVQDVMRTQPVTISELMDQEEISLVFAANNLLALPVVDQDGHMKGVVTVDDIVDVVEEEATEDIQKIGGTEALEAPYLQISLSGMIRKRAGWLTVLFIGEMLTASTMQFFENEIAKAVILALFLPLIISSGGNAGSQASTLVIRAMALGEVKPRDWWRVTGREFLVGLALGGILAAIGLLRVLVWQAAFKTYGQYFVLIGATVACSVVGVVLWGTLVGSFLPFVLKKAGFDPASASAPFVATLVDVTGIVIYFTVASALLRGTLL
ncbi:MAG: magnesium transporter [Candidatus Melainabacteria bacterium]|nr:MAG: magnesium transporter [Candidatus Melainabacteria bacterium]